MSQLTLELRVTDERRARGAGDVVRGTALANAGDVVTCRPLFVRLAHAPRGASAKREAARVELLRGELEPGSHTFPFELRVPEGAPASPDGDDSIAWFVEVEAEVFGVNPVASRRIKVVERARPRPIAVRSAGAATGLLALVAGAGATVAGGALARDVLVASAWSDSSRVVLAAILLFGGPALAALGLFRLAVRLAWGRVTLELPRDSVARGGTLPCTLRVAPFVPLTLRNAVVRLRGARWRSSNNVGYSSSTSSYSERAVAEVVASTGKGRIVRSGDVLELSLAVPADAERTSRDGDAHVSWDLQATLRARGVPTCRLSTTVRIT
jgi:hypothetical protein